MKRIRTFSCTASVLGLGIASLLSMYACGKTDSLEGLPCPCATGYFCCDDVCTASECSDFGVANDAALFAVDAASHVDQSSNEDGAASMPERDAFVADRYVADSHFADSYVADSFGSMTADSGDASESIDANDGAVCTATCGAGLRCVANECICDSISCGNGCCTASTCEQGAALANCGSNANACWTCAGSETCSSGNCTGGSAEVILFGGHDATNTYVSFDDTWSFDGATWTQRASSGPTFGEFSGGIMATLGNTPVLFDSYYSDTDDYVSETWNLVGTQWTKLSTVSPPARDYTSMTTLGSNVILFGGLDEGGGSDNNTWTWNGSTWTQHVGSGPGGRDRPAFAALAGNAVLFGGTISGFGGQNDTWLWNGTSWTEASTASPPSARAGAAMATLGNTIVLFGGANDSNGTTSPLADTWIWNGTTWSKPTLTVSPPARYEHSMATLGNKVVLFGGYASTFTQTQSTPIVDVYLDDTWTWDGTSWTQVSASGPSARSDFAMATLP
jgi:hypothetical protein